MCTACSPGKADLDENPATTCDNCTAGTFSPAASSECGACVPGQTDLDNDASTACSPCPTGRYNNQTQRAAACDHCNAGRFGPARGSTSFDACEGCGPGQHAAIGSTACTACAGGHADEDHDASTPCTQCSNGTFSACAATLCLPCADGKHDSDLNPATPCTDCPLGSYWESPEWFDAALEQNMLFPADCISCPAGRADTDLDSTTPCSMCAPGKYAAARSIVCDPCNQGTVDADDDPSTPCVGGSSCTQVCPQGYDDDDCSQATPCTECPAGQYSDGGARMAPEVSICIGCAPGRHAPQGSNISACQNCPLGHADTDLGAWTVCEPCPRGTITADASGTFTVTNATQCFACIAGTADTDNDASTVCVACTSGEQARDGHTCETCSSGATDHDADPATPCAECPNGQYNDEAGFVGQCTGCPVGFAGNGTGLQTESAACVPCPAGKWSQEVGSPTCGACPVPTYRGLGDRGGCQPCNRQEYRCNSSGLAHPSAAPGYFLNPAKLTQLIFDVVFDVSMIEECTPFVACAGACPAAALEQAPPAYDQCPGGVGEQSCSAGYTGDRCSACWEFDPGLQCTDTTPNGYYRLDGRCEPCPCGGVSMSVILGLCAVGLLVFMFLMDFVMQKVKHISTIVAPFMIILTFCQTVALLLDLEVTWPPQLRILMQQLNVLNINIELARPECTGPFGVAEKMNLTLAMPVALCLLLLVYAALKSVHARCHETVEHFQAAHQGKTPVEFVIQQCTVIVSTVFVSCSIFFLRNVLNVFNCHYDPLTGSKYLKVEPEIECNTDDMGGEYAVLRFRAWVGLLAYCGVYAAFVVGSKINRELFSFLGDKFEDKWYFWELVLVARKVGIMTSFLFFNRTPAQSWLFGSMIITGSLVAHAFARPCEYLVSVSIYMYVQR